MKAGRDNFMKPMNGLGTGATINAIDKTRDTAEGEIFRDCGFEIIDGRVSEEESGKIYSDISEEGQRPANHIRIRQRAA